MHAITTMFTFHICEMSWSSQLLHSRNTSRLHHVRTRLRQGTSPQLRRIILPPAAKDQRHRSADSILRPERHRPQAAFCQKPSRLPTERQSRADWPCALPSFDTYRFHLALQLMLKETVNPKGVEHELPTMYHVVQDRSTRAC
jgi:hypothetical protein